MSLKDKIDTAIREAMKAREKEKLEALRAVKAAILVGETEKGSSGQLNADQELKLLQKLIKQRRESAAIYSDKGRQDLADVEIQQLSVIETFLPAMMDSESLTAEIKSILLENQINDPKDFGKAMGIASKMFAGKADNKMIADILRSILGN